MIEYLKSFWFERYTSLEADIALLTSLIDWKMRMVLIYRVERKRIIRSQLNNVQSMIELIEFLIE